MSKYLNYLSVVSFLLSKASSLKRLNKKAYTDFSSGGIKYFYYFSVIAIILIMEPFFGFSQMNKIELVFQYFDGCPHAGELRKNVMDSISGFEGKIDYREELINTQELAVKHKFRGSPTLIINGEDFENMLSPENPALACRFYSKGVPTKEKIIERLKSLMNN